MRFKRALAVIAAAAVLFCGGTSPAAQVYAPLFSIAADEQEVHSSGDWNYVTADGGVRVVEYTFKDEDPSRYSVALPTELDGKKVVSFAAGTFDGCEYVYTLKIMDTTADFDANWLKGTKVNTIMTDEFYFSMIPEKECLQLDSWFKRSTGRSDDMPVSATAELGTLPALSETAIPVTTTSKTVSQTTSVTTTAESVSQTSSVTTTVPAENEVCDVVIPDMVAGYPVAIMSGSVFANVKNIGKLTLPDTLLYLNDDSFRNCSMTSVNIPKSVTIVPSYCFRGCTSLKEVTLHDDIDVIAYTAFEDCPCFADIPQKYLDENAQAHYDGQYYLIDKTIGDWRIEIENLAGREREDTAEVGRRISLVQYVGVPESSVVTIPKEVGGYVINYSNPYRSVFDDVDSAITEVRFEEGATVIPRVSTPDLKKIELPESVSEIGSILSNSHSLESITIPANIKRVNGTFMNCENLKEVIFEGDEIEIGMNTFYDTAIEKLELPGNCSLTPQGLPGSLEEISFRAGDRVYFNGFRQKPLTGLKRLIFDPEIKEVTVSSNVFDSSSLESIEFPDCKLNIEFGAFRRCKGLKEVTIKNGADIGSLAFSECTELEKVTLIGDCTVAENAFSSCPKLKEVVLETTSPISGRCFDNCPSLTKINGIDVIPEGATEPVPELRDYFYGSFQTANNIGFVNAFVLNNAKKVVAEYTDDSMNDMQKAKALHDWVCNNTKYASEDEQNLKNLVDSSIYMDGVAVCDGYSRTYNLLLHEAGVESVYVRNKTHAWNLVKLDGKWFHVDTTWDDGEPFSYDWFLRSDKQMIDSGEYHNVWELSLPSVLHSFQPETIPACVTLMGDMNDDSEFGFADVTKLREDIIANSAYSVTGDMNFDGKLTPSDIATALSKLDGWKYPMGDVNGDGKADSSDASAILSEYSHLSVGAAAGFTAEQTVAADVNADGKTDSMDASVILAYYSYLSTGGTDPIAKFIQ